jgi:hypothetical protein
LDVLIAYTTGGCSWKDDKGTRKRECPERRENTTLDAMPHHREAGDLFWYNDRVSRTFSRNDDREMFRGEPPAAFKGGREQVSRKPFSAWKHRSYAASFARPTRRRACTILRPEAVFARARNPWVVARFFFFG